MNSDSDGFIIPDRPLSNDETVQILTEIRDDTRELIRLLQGQTRSNILRQARPVGPDSPDRAVRQLTRQQERAERRATVDQARDARGRFGGGEAGGSKGEKEGMFARLKAAIADGAGGAGGDLDKVDPAIEAANEMRNMIAGPMKGIGMIGKAVIGRGFSGGKGGKDTAEPWYRRMLVQMRLMRKEGREYSEAERRAINGGRSGGGGGGDGLIMEGIKLLFSPIGALLLAGIATAWVTIGNKLVGAWNGVLDRFLGLFDPIVNFFKDKFNIVASAGNAANDMIKSLTGIDVKGTAKGVAVAGAAVAKVTAKVVSNASEAVQTTGGSLLGKVMPSYRHKADFSGISGGDALTKYGRYTNSEAEQIRTLKSSGANTSANLPGGMPKDIQEKVIKQAKAAGLPPEDVLKVVSMESGGNPNAISSTGAVGIMQLVGGTASSLGVKDRFNVDQNIAGGIELMKQNAASLKKSGLPATPENLYMMHQLSPGSAKEIIAGAASGKAVTDLSSKAQGEMAKNYGAGSKTAKEYMEKNSAALDSRLNSVVGKSATGFLPTAAPAMPQVKAASMPSLPPPPSIPTAAFSPPPPPPPPPRADIPARLNSEAPTVVTLANDQMINQDMRDRRLAQIATGNVGGVWS